MKPKTLLVLTLLAASLAAFILFYEKDLASTDERQQAEQVLIDLEAEDVRAVELTWRAGDAPRLIRLEKELPTPAQESEAEDDELDLMDRPTSWRLREPLDARADSSSVKALLDRLLALKKLRTLEEIDTAELGFETPRGSIVLETDAGRHQIDVGIELPLSGDLALRRADTPSVAYQVAGSPELLDDLAQEPGAWRDKALFTGMRGNIDRVEIEPAVALGQTGATPQRVVLVRRGQGESYWLESPLEDQADTSQVNGLINTLTGLRASSFLDNDPRAPGAGGEGEELGSFELGLREQEQPWKLVLLHDGLAQVDGQWVRLEAAALLEALERPSQEWRSQAWTSLQVFALEWSRFQIDGSSFEIAREGGEWKRAGDKISYTAATDALYPISEIRAEALLSTAEARSAGFELESPLLEVVLGTTTDETSLRLFAAGIHDGKPVHPATTAGRETVLLLAAEKVEEILQQVKTLRDAPAGDAAPIEDLIPET